MSSTDGFAGDAGLWPRAAAAGLRPPARASASAGASAYPGKYLQPRWRRIAGPRTSSGARRATLPLGLLVPIALLLMISVTWRLEGTGQDIDAQVLVRVAGYALAGIAVLFAAGRGKLPLSGPILLWALVPLSILATTLYAPEKMFTFTAGLAHLALLFYAWHLANRFGQARVALVVVVTGLIVGALSIFVYYAAPDVGRSIASSLNADPGGRMRGVTAQPNTLGSICALTILLAVMHYHLFTSRQRVLAVLAIGVGVFCLYFSESRTTAAALALCLLLWAICRTNAAMNLFAVVGIALGACLIIAFVPDVTSYLTRAGAGSQDLTSLNGRTRIWDVAWEFIYAHPIIGQGYGSSRWFLPNDDRLFVAAVNTHDVYLELLFSGGLLLLGVYAIAVIFTMFRSATRRRIEALVALLFFMVVGVTEATPFAGLPLFSAFVFYVAVALCLVRPSPQGTVAPRRIARVSRAELR